MVGEKDYDYKVSLAELDPEKLIGFLPGWEFEEKVFVSEYKGKELVGEKRGWIFEPPGKYSMVEVERDAKRVSVLGGRNSVAINGVRIVYVKGYAGSTVLSFKSRHAELSISIPKDEQEINVRLDTGRKYPNTTRVHLEITPQLGLRLSPQTTLGDLLKHI